MLGDLLSLPYVRGLTWTERKWNCPLISQVFTFCHRSRPDATPPNDKKASCDNTIVTSHIGPRSSQSAINCVKHACYLLYDYQSLMIFPWECDLMIFVCVNIAWAARLETPWLNITCCSSHTKVQSVMSNVNKCLLLK